MKDRRQIKQNTCLVDQILDQNFSVLKRSPNGYIYVHVDPKCTCKYIIVHFYNNITFSNLKVMIHRFGILICLNNDSTFT
jgi:hypothetical protein